MPPFSRSDLRDLFALRHSDQQSEYGHNPLHWAGVLVSYAIEQCPVEYVTEALNQVLQALEEKFGALFSKVVANDIDRLLLRWSAKFAGVGVGAELPPISFDDAVVRNYLDRPRKPLGKDGPVNEDFADTVQLIRGRPWQMVWGSIVDDLEPRCEQEDHGGVIGVRIYRCEKKWRDQQSWFVPWSRFQPTDEYLGRYRSSTDAVLTWLQERSLFSSCQSVAVDLIRAFDGVAENELVPALPHAPSFTGDSLGLPIALALFGLSKGRTTRAWATGNVSGKPLKVTRVNGGGQKIQHLVTFLACSAGERELGRSTGRQIPVFIPGTLMQLAEVANVIEVANIDVNRLRPGKPRVAWETLQEVLDDFDFLTDPFVPREDQAATALPPEDKTIFFDHVSNLAGAVMEGWGRADADCDEALLSTPFHADADDAAQVLEHAAYSLAMELARQRQNTSRDAGSYADVYSAPLVLDLGSIEKTWPGYDALAASLVKQNERLYEGLSENDVRIALGRQNRLVFVLFDTALLADGSQLRQRAFDKNTATMIRSVFEGIRKPSGDVLAVKPQRIIWVFPDRHVQMFAEERLENPAVSRMFKSQPFPAGV